MTVKDLIAVLANCDPDMQVIVPRYSDYKVLDKDEIGPYEALPGKEWITTYYAHQHKTKPKTQVYLSIG